MIISVQAFLLVPLYIAAIGPRLYGAWLGSGEVLNWLQVLDLGFSNFMIQRIGAAHGSGRHEEIGRWFAAGTVLLVLTGGVMALVVLAVAPYLPGLMGLAGSEGTQLRAAFTVGSVIVGVGIINYAFVGLARGVQDTKFMNGVLVSSAVAGAAGSWLFLVGGFGLWAIVLGLCVRTAVTFVGGLAFSMRIVTRDQIGPLTLDRAALRQFLLVSPVTALGGLAQALMTQSESFLVAAFTHPELAVVLSVTRRASDIGRIALSGVGSSAYGGFAHLVGSRDRSNAVRVYRELDSLLFGLGIPLATAYVAVNASFVAIWVGPENYGGLPLTLAMGAYLVVAGRSSVLNALYRATGRMIPGGLALIVESIVRVPLMIVLLRLFGLPGLPAAGIVTSGVAGAIVGKWLLTDLGSVAPAAVGLPTTWVARVVLFAVAAVLGCALTQLSWLGILVVGGLVSGGALTVLLLTDAVLNGVANPVLRRLGVSAIRITR